MLRNGITLKDITGIDERMYLLFDLQNELLMMLDGCKTIEHYDTAINDLILLNHMGVITDKERDILENDIEMLSNMVLKNEKLGSKEEYENAYNDFIYRIRDKVMSLMGDLHVNR